MLLLTATGVKGICFEIATDGLALNPVTCDSGFSVYSELAVVGYDEMIACILLFSPAYIPFVKKITDKDKKAAK